MRNPAQALPQFSGFCIAPPCALSCGVAAVNELEVRASRSNISKLHLQLCCIVCSSKKEKKSEFLHYHRVKVQELVEAKQVPLRRLEPGKASSTQYKGLWVLAARSFCTWQQGWPRKYDNLKYTATNREWYHQKPPVNFVYFSDDTIQPILHQKIANK
jgi:hypothetical protein